MRTWELWLVTLRMIVFRSSSRAVGQPLSFHISVIDDELTHERRSPRRQVVPRVDRR